MGVPDPKGIVRNVPLGGASRGISSLSPHLLRPGEVKNLENFLFDEEGAETRLGWDTVAAGSDGAFGASFSFPGSQTGAIKYELAGKHVGFSNNDDAKIIAFQKYAQLQDDLDLDFDGGGQKIFAAPSANDWLGVLFFAETFLLYTEVSLHSIRSGISAVAFTGAGLDDCTSNSSDYLDNSKSLNVRVEIDATGTPDSFRWSIDGGVSWKQSGVDITGSAQELSDGIEVTFAATTGHTIGDYWDIITGPKLTGATLIEELNFRNDLGDEFGPIIGISDRFGQLWVITKKDRLFWSTALKYKIDGGTQIEDQGLEQEWTTWQSVIVGPIFSMDEVEFLAYYKGALAKNTYVSYTIENGTNHCSVEGSTSDWAVSDIVYPEDESETKTVSSVNVPTNAPFGAIAASDVLFRIALDGNGYYKSYQEGTLIKIVEGGNTEYFTLGNAIRNSGGGYITCTLAFGASFVNAYTVAAVVTNEDAVTLGLSSNWTANYNSAQIVKDVWADVPAADYDLSLDPDNDPDADGHIKFKDTPTVKNAEGLRCSYTPVDNAWTGGSSGAWDIASDRGNNVAYAEGPNAREQEGAAVLYIFKSNGDIHAITGRELSLDAKVIATGIIARANTPRTSREGVYFGSIRGVKYDVYFIPHGAVFGGVEQIPLLTDSFFFDYHLPLDDSSYTIDERTFIIDGDKYAIVFPYYTGVAPPITNGYIYVGQAYKEGNSIKGRWSRIKEHAGDEYEESSGNTIAAGGAPTTEGFYYLNDVLCRVYRLRSGKSYELTSQYWMYYEVSTLGWFDGGEECKDEMVYTYDAGGGTGTTEVSTDYFWAKIKLGMLKIAERIVINKLFVDQDIIGGTEADGIDMLIDVFTDLQYSQSEFAPENPKIISNLTDDEDGLRILVGMDLKINCKYFQFEYTWKNIKYRDKPARVFYRDSALGITVLTPKGKLPEEDV